MTLKINEKFHLLLPELLPEEFNALRESIIKEGCREPLIVWDEVIIDGHNRYKICNELNIDFKIREVTFENEDEAMNWIDANQLARRNLTADAFRLTLGRLYNRTKKGKGNPTGLIAQNGSLPTAQKIGKEFGVSKNTVIRAEKFYIEVEQEPELKEAIHKRLPIKKIKKERKEKAKEETRKKVASMIEDKSEIKLDDLVIGWYKIGKQYLYYGDNRDENFYNYLPKCSMGFADPPYNAGVDKWDYEFKWEQDKFIDKCKVMLVTPGGWNAYNFYNETKMNYMWEICCWIKNGMTHGRCGYANFIKVSVFANIKPKIEQDLFVITIKTNETEDTKHKGRKPYDFMAKLINDFSKEGDNIFDLFAGSGTTLFMSEKLGRVSYNSEIDNKYCLDIIRKGISNGMQLKRI